jgi:hypothetical protein
MNTNDRSEQGSENGRWHEKVLNFQNASVYLQLLNARMASKLNNEQESEQESEDETQTANS